MIGIGISNSVGAYRSFVDPAASAYFAATGITGTTEQQAVNTLVTSLKSAGLWSKMKAVYPFVTDNRNLLSYTEDFGNAAWFKPNGTVVTNVATAPNGTNTADSYSSTTASTYHPLYELITGSLNTYTYSVYVKKVNSRYFSIKAVGGSTNWAAGIFDLDNVVVTKTQTSTMTNQSATIVNVGNGWYRATLTFTGSLTDAGVQFSDSGTSSFSNYADIIASGTGVVDYYLWGAQLELGSSATTYQPIATTQQSYISNQFKYNLVNPVDSDAAFRGVFNGGWTFSNQGATPNGTNGYMDTKFIPASNLTINDQSYSVYSRTNTAAGDKRELGVNYFGEISVIAKFTGDLFYPIIGGGAYPNVSNTDSRGHYIANRTDATNIKGYKNGSLILNALQNSLLPTTYGIYIGCRNDNGVANQYTDRQLAFSHLGQGLTNSEATALYNAVQTFNTSLARQVA